MKVLVTGGAGFIGSWVTKLLVEDGNDVVVFDNLSTGFKKLVPDGALLVEGDLSDRDSISNALDGCDAVVHMAASSIVPESVKNPVGNFESNLRNGLNLLEAMRGKNVNNMIFSSTAAVYGEPRSVPISESDEKIPASPYGVSKLSFEHYLYAYHGCYGLKSISLRYFNAYGPNELHNPETHAVPNFVKATLDKKPLTLFGTGEQIRDFVYVEDIARAHVETIGKRDFAVYNIGDGVGTSVNDLIEKISSLIGHKTEIIRRPAREGDPLKLVSDTSRIRKEIGWEPKIGLEDGLERTIEWFKNVKGSGN